MALLGDTTALNVDVLDDVMTTNIMDAKGSIGSNSYVLIVDENGNIKWVAVSTSLFQED